MKHTLLIGIFLLSAIILKALPTPNTEVIETSAGKLTIYFVGHGSLVLDCAGKIIQIDPWSKIGDYRKLPKADILLITHEHPDHLDTSAINKTLKPGTQTLTNSNCHDILHFGNVMKNGDTKTIDGIVFQAVPAYNTTKDKMMYHPKGRDNGFVITFGGKRIYIAGDTEAIPEMADLKNIDIAFLPMNQPYTMTQEQVVEAVKMFHPKILYPYHTGSTDVQKLVHLMKKVRGTEVIVRSMK